MFKVLQVNNYGFVRGGSDRYFVDLSTLLAKNGHSIKFLTSYSVENIVSNEYAVDGIDVRAPSVAEVAKFLYSFDAKAQLEKLIEDDRPDIAHLHIYYGQITASIISLLRRHRIPIVQTLHEYKLLCPVSTMTREMNYCDACAAGAYWQSARHRCNRNSLSRSLASAAEAYLAKFLGAEKGIDHFIAVSGFLRDRYVENGISEKRISVVHNFVPDSTLKADSQEGEYFLYFGRIERIKGLGTLVEAMRELPHISLKVVGVGDYLSEIKCVVRKSNLSNIEFVGFQATEELGRTIDGAIAVVVPSEWDETFGLTIVESYSKGKPVIASRSGGMVEIVTDGVDGVLFDAGNVCMLRKLIVRLHENRADTSAMGSRGFEKARSMFSENRHYEKIVRIYSQAIANKSGKSP